MICTECGNELIKVSTPLVEELRGEKFTIEGIERYECPKCGNYEISLDMADKLSADIWEQYRQKHGILSPDQIKRIRAKLGVTQKELEQMFCVSHPTVSRWETGMYVPSPQSSRQLEALRDVPGFAEYLMKKSEVRRKKIRVISGEMEFTNIPISVTKGTLSPYKSETKEGWYEER